MARILLGTIPIAGHVAPLLSIARALIARGHELVWYTGAKYQALVAGSGATPARFTHARDFDDAAYDGTFPGRSELKGIAQLRYDLRHVFVEGITGQLADLAALQRELSADLLLMDPGLVGGALHAELSGTPNVVVGVVPLPCSSRDTAPFGPGLAPRADTIGQVRNAVLNTLVQRVLLRDVQKRWNELRREHGLPPTSWWIDAGIRGAALYLQPTIAAFEYPRRDLPANVRFIGPLPVRPALVPEHPDFWHELHGTRPVVHVTQGTLANANPDLIAPAIAGLADEDALVVVATGGRDPASLGLSRVPGNVRVARFFDYGELLPRLSVMVTNGGYGGVQLALSHGVPLVVSGVTEDKAEVAARVAWSGAGIDLRAQRPSPAAVREAVKKVLANPGFRQRARTLASEYARHDAVSTAVDAIERTLTQHAPSRPPASRATPGTPRAVA
jgi:MGT family glycosyltransferase